MTHSSRNYRVHFFANPIEAAPMTVPTSFVVAATSWPRLRGALEARMGSFLPPRGAQGPSVRARGVAYAGQHDGATYLTGGEPDLAWEASPDLFVNLSSELQTVVVAGGYRIASQERMLLVAVKGSLLRYFYAAPVLFEPALAIGTPISTEQHAALDTELGLGRALQRLGFDIEGWARSAGRGTIVVPREREMWKNEEGPHHLLQRQRLHARAASVTFRGWARRPHVQTDWRHAQEPERVRDDVTALART